MGTTESLLDEHFVAIPDYPNYEVSNYGRVVNITTGKDIAHWTDASGTVQVTLHNRGRTRIAVRKLVAEGFFADYKSWMPVYFISDDKTDCSVLNLTLKAPEPPTPSEYIRINELGEEFATVREVAVRIQGSDSVISKCLMGLGKTHKGYTFSKVTRG